MAARRLTSRIELSSPPWKAHPKAVLFRRPWLTSSWDGLEHELEGAFRAKALKVHLARYADDFIITGARKELLEEEVRQLVEQFLHDRGLELSSEKTCVTHIEQGFDFLGQNVRRFGRKLLIQPSKKNTHAFLDKVRELIRRGAWMESGLADPTAQPGHSWLG